MPWQKPYTPARNQRLTPELYAQANQVCFVTVRAFKSQIPFVREGINSLVLQMLREEAERQRCLVFTYCLMPNHVHFLASPAEDGFSVLTLTNSFKGRLTNASWELGWHGKLWQPRYFDHLVRAEEDLLAIANYILANPVRKGLVDQPEDWRWSGHMNLLPI